MGVVRGVVWALSVVTGDRLSELAVARCRRHLAVHVRDGGARAAHVESRPYVLLGLAAQGLPQDRPPEEPGERRGQRVGVAGRYEAVRGVPGGEALAGPVDVREEHRAAGGHGLQRGEGHALPAGRQDGEVGQITSEAAHAKAFHINAKRLNTTQID